LNLNAPTTTGSQFGVDYCVSCNKDAPNGTRRTQTYDLAGRLETVQDVRMNDGATIVNLEMRYDAAGRLWAKRQLPAWPAVPPQSPRTAITDADNRLENVGGTPVTHDDDGNVLSAPSALGIGVHTYAWNVRNQLVGGSSGVTRTHDALGNRISMTANGTTTTYAVDPVGGSMPRVLWSKRGTEQRIFYVYAGDTLLYQFTETGNVAHYYHFDHIGSTVALSDAGGTVTDRFAYSTYGREIGRTGTTETPFRFCGAHGVSTDPDGLVHMRARYYHPGLGRFLSKDPIQFEGGTNWYAYAEGNPAMFVDPTGNIVETVWDVANIGMGVYSLQDSIGKGSWGWAALDAVGLIYDSAATAVPFLPAGASAGLKAYRAGNTVVHSVNAGMDIARVSNEVHSAARTIDAGAMTSRQAAHAGTQLHRQVASQTAGSLSYFDNSFMAGAHRASGRQPDLIGIGTWADITTTRQWNRHVGSYSSNFGTGIPVFYQRGIGVVGTTRLLPGAGLGLSVPSRK
jgi:RHS repeat-associated protein